MAFSRRTGHFLNETGLISYQIGRSSKLASRLLKSKPILSLAARITVRNFYLIEGVNANFMSYQGEDMFFIVVFIVPLTDVELHANRNVAMNRMKDATSFTRSRRNFFFGY